MINIESNEAEKEEARRFVRARWAHFVYAGSITEQKVISDVSELLAAHRAPNAVASNTDERERCAKSRRRNDV